MRIAALYDIHGNLPALEAVLDEIRPLGVDRIVVGGDVLPGPMPRETMARLLDLDIPAQFIVGNCEVAALDVMAGKKLSAAAEPYRHVVEWSERQLPAEHRIMIAAWPKTLRLEIRGIGDVLFCHGTPRDENECFTRITSQDVLAPIFANAGAALVVCGHTHMQFDRMIGTTRVVNAGSVGMPFGEPGAYWLLLGPEVELRRTQYDLNRAADRIRATNYPQAEEFANRYVLQPPSEEQMLEVFSRATLK
jgi:predicted phosphodiesterase